MFTRLWSKLRSIRRDTHFDSDLSDELDFHRAMLERDRAREGVAPDAAALEARRRIGNVAVAHEDSRRAWAFGWIEDVARDVRLAIRGYRRSPGFTLIAILVLALGLGANMAVFRFVDAALFETLPVSRPEELVRIEPRKYSYPAFQEIAKGTQDVLASAAAWFRTRANLTVGGQAEYLSLELVSGRYFDTLDVRPALGRVLTVEDDGAEGAHPVCTISYGLWQRMFAGAPDIVGTVVRLNNEPFEIVGVTARGFQGAALHERSDVQVPLAMSQAVGWDARDSYGMRWLSVIGRLAPGVSREQADGVIRARYEDLEAPGPGMVASPFAVTEGRQGFAVTRSNLVDAVVVAQLLSACVLLIACASLAGLLLARVSARRHEMAMRLALGALRRRLVVQLLIETTGLAVAGAVVATWLSMALGGLLARMLAGPESTFQIAATPSPRGLAVATLATMVTAMGVGLMPALSATRTRPLHTLRESGRTTSGTSRLGGPLVVAQIAGCLVLLFGAGLLGRTLHNVRAIDLGLDPEQVVVVTASPTSAGHSDDRRTEFYAEWLSGAERTPGVISASLAVITAMTDSMFAFAVDVPDADVRSGPTPRNTVNVVSPDYFRTVGLPIVAGRAFTDEDSAQSDPVAIVNERFAEYYWPGQSPIGRQFGLPRGPVTIVGLVPTAKYGTVLEEPQITFYLPLAQRSVMAGEATLHARVNGETGTVAASLVRAAREIDLAVPIHGVATLTDYVDARLANERVLNVIGVLFGALALLVSAAGLYGTVAYAVARRTREIGIRTAIGAQRRDIVSLFAGRTLWLVAAGIAIGVPAALVAGRSLAGVLYGVEPASVSTLAAAVVLLASVAVTAAVVPALRGARLDPSSALREP